ncbi:hypothetical protein [Salininema proteolyticum]|uniref:Uncharacterized protein n=1 Tax=Salininema proteolyticum TaxID=1607685 RepID=A0ABV8TTF9_9ACTN
MAALSTVDVSVASPVNDLDGDLVSAAAGGDTAEVATSNMFLVVKNDDASSHTATIATPGAVKGLAIDDVAVTVADGDYAIVPLSLIFRGSTGRASISYDAVTSVSVGVFRMVI